MNVVVFLGASLGNKIEFELECKNLGAMIGKNQFKLIYGGSKSGLMGILADSVIQNGGSVIGIEPKMFIDRCFQHPDLEELIITKDLLDRKDRMNKMGDVFIAFPGGTGTLDEIIDVMELTTLNEFNDFNKECIFFNLNGYYDLIKKHLDKIVESGFSTKERLKHIHFIDTVEEIEQFLKEKDYQSR